MLPFDPSVLMVLLKAFLVLIAVCTAGIFAGFYFEQRSYNRQLCRERERLLRAAAAREHRRNDFAETCKVIGGSGGRR